MAAADWKRSAGDFCRFRWTTAASSPGTQGASSWSQGRSRVQTATSSSPTVEQLAQPLRPESASYIAMERLQRSERWSTRLESWTCSGDM